MSNVSRSGRIVKPLSAVLMGLGVVVSALQLGPDDAPPAYAATMSGRYYDEGELPEYPGSVEFPMGSGMAVNGAAIRVSQFSVEDSPQKVSSFYLDEFKARGIEANSVRGKDGAVSISALSSDGMTQFIIAVVPRLGKGSNVFPSAFPLDGEVVSQVEGDKDIPASPAAVGIMRVEARNEHSGRTVTYQEPMLKGGEAAALVRETMVARGWTVKSSTPPSGSVSATVLEFSRGSAEAHFTVSAQSSSSTGAAIFARYSPTESLETR